MTDMSWLNQENAAGRNARLQRHDLQEQAEELCSAYGLTHRESCDCSDCGAAREEAERYADWEGTGIAGGCFIG